MEEYKKWSGLNKSSFKHILKSGLHYKYYLEHGDDKSDIMQFGNLVDTLLLEPSLFLSRYITIPEKYESDKGLKPWNWNANVCKEWREQVLDDTPEIEIIKTDDLDRARKIVDAIKSHAEAGKWIDGSLNQVSLCWTDPETGIDCKGRVDVLREDRIIDLKVTDNPHPSSFSGIVNRFLYHAGGAFYHDGYLLAQGKKLGSGPDIPFSFIAAEAENPHDVVTYDLGPESFDCGRIIYREAIARYKEMIETGEYNGYSQVTEEIEIPMWARNRVQMEGVIE